MPSSIDGAIKFLETQWSSINDNKLKGIKAEVDFRDYLENKNVHYIPGGWILSPGKNTNVEIPCQEKICLLPIEIDFSWVNSGQGNNNITPALISAYNYFRQVGVITYFVVPESIDENSFKLPSKRQGTTKAIYPRPYSLLFKTILPNGQLEDVNISDVMINFPNSMKQIYYEYLI